MKAGYTIDHCGDRVLGPDCRYAFVANFKESNEVGIYYVNSALSEKLYSLVAVFKLKPKKQ